VATVDITADTFEEMIFREQVVLYSQAGMLNNSQLKEVINKVKELDMTEVHAEIAKQADA